MRRRWHTRQNRQTQVAAYRGDWGPMRHSFYSLLQSPLPTTMASRQLAQPLPWKHYNKSIKMHAFRCDSYRQNVPLLPFVIFLRKMKL